MTSHARGWAPQPRAVALLAGLDVHPQPHGAARWPNQKAPVLAVRALRQLDPPPSASENNVRYSHPPGLNPPSDSHLPGGAAGLEESSQLGDMGGACAQVGGWGGEGGERVPRSGEVSVSVATAARPPPVFHVFSDASGLWMGKTRRVLRTETTISCSCFYVYFYILLR